MDEKAGAQISRKAFLQSAAVPLISLSLTIVSNRVWIRWTSRLWFFVLLLAIALQVAAVAIGYGPF